MNKFFSQIKNLIKFIFPSPQIERILNIQIQNTIKKRQILHTNPFCKYGKFGFSQSDEDGLTLEIIKRLRIKNGSFCEFGVGDGSENNTLILLAKGWSGNWIGAQDLCFQVPKESRLKFIKEWITKDNIYKIYCDGIGQNKKIDLISLDLDGNDFYLIEELLEKNIKPKIFIVEYNAKFPPPIEFIIHYDPNHTWKNDDYFGASLTSYVKLFDLHDYKLIGCNAATGSNAFFVRGEYAKFFPETPSDIEDIYVEPFYYLPKKIGHKDSIKTIKKIIS